MLMHSTIGRSIKSENALFWILAVILCHLFFRILAIGLSDTDLFVDESQYWLWGQKLDLGYFSKPPLIGWVLGFFDAIAPDRTPFWVRLPAPIFHAATALLIALFVRSKVPEWPAAGAMAAATYLTMPIVGIGSFLISTDTIMAPFLFAAIWLLFEVGPRKSVLFSVMAGGFLGLAFLAKYAAIYGLIGLVLMQVFSPEHRLKPTQLLSFSLAFLIVISPNVYWNLANDLTTLDHTADNAGWVKTGAAFSFENLLTFIASQVVALGPLVFWSVFVGLFYNSRARFRGLIAFVVPAFLVVSAQAFLSEANANWAFAGFLAATVLSTYWFASKNVRLLQLSLLTNLAVSALLWLIVAFPTMITLPDGSPAGGRYLGQAETSLFIVNVAVENGAKQVVASDRAILADLFFADANDKVSIFTPATAGAPVHYYQQEFSWPENSVPNSNVLLVTLGGAPACDTARFIDSVPETWAYFNKAFKLYLVPGSCITPVAEITE